MDFNKLTRKSQEALSEAQGIAIGNNNQEVDVEHLLLALLRDREGLIPRMLRRMDVDAPRVVYVSCNPATLARDARILAGHGYRLTSIRSFDMFPQTVHVETVAVLER